MDELRDKVERVVRQVVLEMLGQQSGPIPSVSEAGRRPLLAANWKMHKLSAEARDFVERLGLPEGLKVEVVLCPPHILLPVLRQALGKREGVQLGAQNLCPEPQGAFTGEHSPAMIQDAGASYVIVGHSERRSLFGEDDGLVARKVRAALHADLRPILCVGETLPQRREGATFRVLRNQLTLALAQVSVPAPDPGDLVVAYEPVWAIGTGQNASPAQAQEAMAFIRDRLAELFSRGWAERVRLLYGGSASPENVEALAILPDVDGFLVGGASLDPAKFTRMVAATARVTPHKEVHHA